jgi:hypothetical protein
MPPLRATRRSFLHTDIFLLMRVSMANEAGGRTTGRGVKLRSMALLIGFSVFDDDVIYFQYDASTPLRFSAPA